MGGGADAGGGRKAAACRSQTCVMGGVQPTQGSSTAIDSLLEEKFCDYEMLNLGSMCSRLQPDLLCLCLKGVKFGIWSVACSLQPPRSLSPSLSLSIRINHSHPPTCSPTTGLTEGAARSHRQVSEPPAGRRRDDVLLSCKRERSLLFVRHRCGCSSVFA